MTVGGTTRVLSIIGEPAAYFLTPAMQNEDLLRAGIDVVYISFDVLS